VPASNGFDVGLMVPMATIVGLPVNCLVGAKDDVGFDDSVDR